MQFDGFAVTSEADISEALQRILVGFTTWSEAESIDDETRPARLQEFYNGYGELGELLAFADPGQEIPSRWLGLLDTTLRSQLTDEQLLRFFGNKAKQKLDQPLARPEVLHWQGGVNPLNGSVSSGKFVFGWEKASPRWST